jgi:putative transposase
MVKKRYSSDLTDEEWEILEPLIPVAKAGGHPRTTDIREVISGILYRLKNGCSWENLPTDFPPCKTVFHYYREWVLDGTIEQIHDKLRREVRMRAGRTETPSACIIDSQSVKTTEKGGIADMMRVKRSKAESAILR